MLDRDLALHRSYVCEDNGKIAATFAFTTDGEPTYRVIRGGAWLDDAPYGVVTPDRGGKEHGRGAAAFCLELVPGAVRQHPHRHARATTSPCRACWTRLGYTRICGVIELENGRGERSGVSRNE